MLKSKLQKKILLMVTSLILFLMALMLFVFIVTDYKNLLDRSYTVSLQTARMLSYMETVKEGIEYEGDEVKTDNLAAAVMTLVLTVSLIWLFWYITEKSRQAWEYVPAPSPEELHGLVHNGRRWLMSQVMLMIGFFVLNVFFTLFLFIFFTSGIVFVGIIILWAILFLMLWLLQPFARLSLLRSLEQQPY